MEMVAKCQKCGEPTPTGRGFVVRFLDDYEGTLDNFRYCNLCAGLMLDNMDDMRRDVLEYE